MATSPAPSSTTTAAPSLPSPDTPRQPTQQHPQPPPPSTTTTTTTKPQTQPTYRFPPEHAYPPFYTRQTNQNTLRSQHEKWAALILSYCAHHRLYKLSATSPAGEALFHNRQLNRRLSGADTRDVLDFMRRDGRVEFIRRGAGDDGDGDVVWVYWKTPDEWAALVEAWVDDTALKGTVFTLYELSRGEDTLGTEFHGLDLELLQKALQVLVKRGKAQIFGQEDQLGVKFF
ncbi:vacuolar protein-sorting-associated protein [Xylaria intraflava]|nr:vacuolar protein-sorting-associated protein [Xylaria intraflava]